MQTVSAGAAISVITLPDQTKVTLNRYSSLTYPFSHEKHSTTLVQSPATADNQNENGRRAKR